MSAEVRQSEEKSCREEGFRGRGSGGGATAELTLFHTTRRLLPEQRQKRQDSRRRERRSGVPSMLRCEADAEAEGVRRTGVGDAQVTELRLDAAQLTDGAGELLPHLLRLVVQPRPADAQDQ